MNRKIRLAACGAAILVIHAGCASPATRSDGSRVATTAPATQPVPAPADVPIVYGPRHHLPPGDPPLSAEQLQTILQRAQARCPEGQRVWFIHALANWDMGERREASVEVFFTPETQTARLRKGRFIRYVDRSPELMAAVEALLREWDGGTTAPRAPEPLPEYWQVSRPDHPFTGQPGLPRGSLIPFPAPEGFTEDEVIEIVDFVRSKPRQRQERGTIAVPGSLDTSLPIHRMLRDGDIIEVWTGVQEDMLAGAGEILRCRKKADGGFEVISIGRWYS
jgi:hypothetical protein